MYVIFKYLLFVTLLFCSTPYSFAHKLRFVAEDLPPFHFLDANRNPTGVLVDVIKAVISVAKVDAEIELMPFARCYESTQHQPNVFMFSLLKTSDRTPRFKWLGQTYKAKAYLVGLKSRSDLQLNTIEDAKSLVVGTIRGYHSEHYLKEANFTIEDNLHLSVNYQQMWGMLFKNRIDLVLTNFIALEFELNSIDLEVNDITTYLELEDFPNQLHIATGLTTPDQTIKKLSDALIQIKADGSYQQIMTKWGL